MMSLFGPPNIDKMKAKRDVQGLIKALSYEKDVSVRLGAAKALGEFGDSRAVEPLIVVLRDSDVYVRKNVVEALGRLGDSRAVKPLITALKDSDRDYGCSNGECEKIAEALVEIGIGAVEPLIAAFTNSNENVRKRIVDVLVKIDKTRAVELLMASLKEGKISPSISGALVNIGEFAVGPLIGLFKESKLDANIRKEVSAILGNIGSPALKPLVAALNDSNNSVRVAVAWLLNSIGDASAVGPLFGLLRDSNNEVRLAAFGSLIGISLRMKNEASFLQSMDMLITALKNNNKDVRRAAVQMLGILGDKRAIDPLLASFEEDDDDEVRANAIGSLNDLSVAIPLESLIINLQRTSYPYLRILIVRELSKRSEPRTVEGLITALKDNDAGVRKAAVDELGKRSETQVIDALIATLQDSDIWVRGAAAKELGKFNDIRVLEPLIAVLTDIDASFRYTVLKILERLGWNPEMNENGARHWILMGHWNKCVEIGAPAVEPLIASISNYRDIAKNCEAINALGRIGDVRAVEPLITILQNKNEDKKMLYAAILALGEIGDARAVRPLIDRLDHVEVSDHDEIVVSALVKIGAPAVWHLIHALEGSKNLRKKAAEALVRLYRSKKLNQDDISEILAQREKIIFNHTDQWSEGCGESSHHDIGIGLSFPL